MAEVKKAVCAVGFVVALLGAVGAQSFPVINFILLPDDNGGPGSFSMLTGSMPTLISGSQSVAFDFTEPLSDNVQPRLTVYRIPAQPGSFSVVDFEIRGFDRNLGASCLIAQQVGQLGLLTSTQTGANEFLPSATLSFSVPVTVTLSGGGLAPGPYADVLTFTGTMVPGYYHQTAMLSGGLQGMPAVSLSLHVKQDLLPPGVTLFYVADPNSATLTRTGGTAEVVHGSWTVMRALIDHRNFSILSAVFSSANGPAISLTMAPGSGSSLFLDPILKTVTGTLIGDVNGQPFTRILDGFLDTFEGPAQTPTRIQIREPNLPGLDEIAFDLRRCQMTPNGSVAALGSTFQPRFLGPPGGFYAVAAALDPAPGLNTLVGDAYCEPDALFYFSLAAQNPFFSSMIGVLPASGEAFPSVQIANEPMLAGFTFFMAGVVLDLGAGQVRAVTNSLRVIL